MLRRFLITVMAATLLAAGVYLCSPSFRLWLHRMPLQPASAVQRVDPHTYDPQWFDAARAGRVDILQALHQAGYPVDTRSRSGYTAVVLAAYHEQPRALEYLLGTGADACAGDRNGNTALMGAIYKGYDAVAQRLLLANCPLDQTNHAGETALAFAVLFGRTELLEALVRRGARLDHRDARGQTPMMIAIRQGDEAMVTALRKLGARE